MVTLLSVVEEAWGSMMVTTFAVLYLRCSAACRHALSVGHMPHDSSSENQVLLPALTALRRLIQVHAQDCKEMECAVAPSDQRRGVAILSHKPA